MDERYNAWNYQEYIEKLENEIARLREENKRLAEIPHEQDQLYMQAYINYQTWKEDYARLREAARWIPVGERLPQVGEWVMISEKSGGVSNSFVDFEDYETRTGIEWFGADDVTHWMPLPEPPEVE